MIPSPRSRAARLILLAGACAAIVALTWFVAQQQVELASARAAAAAPAQLTLSVADSPAHATCERIDNHSSHELTIDLRSVDGAQRSLIRIAAHGSSDVCLYFSG